MRANSASAGTPRYRGLRFKMAIGISLFVVALMLIDATWNIHQQRNQAENEALEKAEVLAQEMRAVWDFVDINQEVINRNEDGTFRTKTLVCVVAAKSVSTLFSQNTDYTIRFTSETPRQVVNAPDEFEQQAFDAFAADESVTSYYGVQNTDDGRQVFRYIEPLYVTESCLECHGEPAGELDQYGYAKEGMKLGEIGGAMSITEPMDIYLKSMAQSVWQQACMVLIMVIAACVGMYFMASRLILRRLSAVRTAAKRIGEGDFGYTLDTRPPRLGADELTELAQDFDRMAQQLSTLYTDLDGEVKKRTDELKALNDMLLYQKRELKVALDRLSEEREYKNQFFALVSHELRTPLTSILAFARLLHENDSLDEKTRSSVIEIETNASLLLNLVSNILTISRAEAHKNELMVEPVDFVDLAMFVKRTLDPLADNKDITLTAKADPDVPVSMADWEKLRRVLENLADNAIKYTHIGGTVDIAIRYDPDGGYEHGAIVIQVTDDGIGISADDLPEIFDLYRQASKSPNKRYRGTGLGLAVVKELTELHGGRVSVVSEPKKGSTFTVVIPYVPLPMSEEEDDDDEDSAC